MIVTEDTPTDEQQTNWIKGMSDWGTQNVEKWEGKFVWGGGLRGERIVNHTIVLVM